ncbi:MAG: PQQ-binding-like beta-propeller repeat protein, partial [Candidatus Bathyarchaeota archaeon]
KWSYITGGAIYSSPAIGSDGTVYVGSYDGKLYAFVSSDDVTVLAYCYSESTPVSVSITMDGSPTGYNTPHTFSDLTGAHNFTVPDTDLHGCPFRRWNTYETSTTIAVTTSGTYTAEYAPPVGGIWVPVDRFKLLAPYVGLTSSIVVATVATAIYVKRVKRRKKKQ